MDENLEDFFPPGRACTPALTLVRLHTALWKGYFKPPTGVASEIKGKSTAREKGEEVSFEGPRFWRSLHVVRVGAFVFVCFESGSCTRRVFVACMRLVAATAPSLEI